MSSLVLIPCALLTQGIYAGLIGAISTVTMSACSAIRTIYNYKNADVNHIIKLLDIERKLIIIQSILNITTNSNTLPGKTSLELTDLEKTHVFELIKKKTDLTKDPIQLCLIFLHEAIENIHKDLSVIHEKIDCHNNKWFNYWRSLNIKHLITNLEADIIIMNERFDYLMKISAFLDHIKGSKKQINSMRWNLSNTMDRKLLFQSLD